MKVGSLCSGYGGLELGLLAVVPGTVAWHCEVDPNACRILDERFPDVPNHGDITTLDWSKVEPVEWLTAGYPCQPFSHAGRRKGKDDERHLWPFVADAVGALRPRRVLLENVAGHVSLGLDAVLGDLAALGYDCRWGVVRAADAGAPHGRPRVFVVAADAEGDAGRFGHGDDVRAGRGTFECGTTAGRGAVADTHGERRERGRDTRRRWSRSTNDSVTASDWGVYAPAIRRWESLTGRSAPRLSEPGRNGERLSPRFVEWMQGLPAGWVTDIGISRNAQLKALGNGVVPHQAALALRLLTEPLERAA